MRKRRLSWARTEGRKSEIEWGERERQREREGDHGVRDNDALVALKILKRIKGGVGGCVPTKLIERRIKFKPHPRTHTHVHTHCICVSMAERLQVAPRHASGIATPCSPGSLLLLLLPACQPSRFNLTAT